MINSYHLYTLIIILLCNKKNRYVAHIYANLKTLFDGSVLLNLDVHYFRDKLPSSKLFI